MPEPRRKLRLGNWLLVALAVILAVWFFQSRTISGQSANATTGYIVENGQIAWRPMSGAEKFFVIAISFGQALNSETVNGRTLRSADVASFRVLAGRYGLDRSRVWFEGAQIVGADPKTFQVLERGFAHDAHQVWKGTTPILDLVGGDAHNIDVHSPHIFSVGETTWFAGTPSIQLPERPTAEPVHFCLQWFAMNDAIWEAGERRLVLDPAQNHKALGCDGSVTTRHENDEPYIDKSRNEGIVLQHGPALSRLTLLGETIRIATFPEDITGTQIIGSSVSSSEIVLAQGQSKTIYASGWHPDSQVQSIGRFESLPDDNAIFYRSAFWLDGSYFTVTAAEDDATAFVTNHGIAQRVGEYASIGDAIFWGERIIARPGNLTVRVAYDDYLLVGSACLNGPEFVSDVSDPLAEKYDISRACRAHNQRDVILYDGLRISFQPALIAIGQGDTRPDLPLFEIGSMVIENVSAKPHLLTPEFLGGFDLMISGTSISPPDDAWPRDGVELQTGETHRWTLKVQADGDPFSWGWQLKMRHNAERTAIFGDQTFFIANGLFPSPQ